MPVTDDTRDSIRPQAAAIREDAEKVGETRGGRVYLKIPGNTPL